MVRVSNGKRYEINSDKEFIHTGTPAYLKAIGATPISGTDKEVKEACVDRNGRYVLLDLS
jgi:hypothetical protein